MDPALRKQFSSNPGLDGCEVKYIVYIPKQNHVALSKINFILMTWGFLKPKS